MHEHLQKFKITPRVIKADSTQTITVCGIDTSSAFYDDLEYSVELYPTVSSQKK